MTDHRLILRHFEGWLAKKGQTVDVPLVETLLDLRATYDDLEPTFWPEGSVEDLLLGLWPAKGAVEPPDPERLTASLEAWLKFLRSTGRMSMKSADVKALVKECRRAAPEMTEAAADRAGWSPTKVILDFARTRGITLDDAPDIETAQARLEEAQRVWNELPWHERQRLMPSPGTEHLSESERLMELFGTDDPIVALLMTFAHELPDGELPPPEVTGPQLAAAPYFRTLLDFARWLGDGKPLTSTDNLRLAPAREAYDLLGLESWTRSQHERRWSEDPLPRGVAAVGREAWIERELATPFRSAADCDALERLWWGADAAGLLDVQGRKLVGRPPTEPLDDEAWLGLGCRALLGLFDWLGERTSMMAIITQALMRSYVQHRKPVPFAELAEFYEAWTFEPALRAHLDVERGPRAMSMGAAREAIGMIADTGIVLADDEAVALTDAGDVFVSLWLQVREER